MKSRNFVLLLILLNFNLLTTTTNKTGNNSREAKAETLFSLSHVPFGSQQRNVLKNNFLDENCDSELLFAN
jgi:hypothetical protein